MVRVSDLRTDINPYKAYVSVVVRFDETGAMRPTEIIWEDGRRFEIDRVTDVRQAPSRKAGGVGDRYTVWIKGRETFLYFDPHEAGVRTPGRWFMERRVARR